MHYMYFILLIALSGAPDRRKRRTRRDIVEHTVVPTAVTAIYVLARRINILLLIPY